MGIPNEITIHVTEEDIENGTRGGNSYSCAISLAMQRELVGCSTYVTGVTALFFKDENDEQRVYALPSEACQFIRDFDFEKPVVPFKFTALRDPVLEEEGFE
jgi:hypothetical protein